MSGVGGRYVGEQITVTDARGVSGPGVVTAVDSGGFDVDVLFRHTDGDGDTVDQYCWYFLKGRSRDFGLKLDFTPYRRAPVEGGVREVTEADCEHIDKLPFDLAMRVYSSIMELINAARRAEGAGQ